MTSLTPARPRAVSPRKKLQPAGAVLAGGHVDTEDFAVAVGVHAGGDQAVDPRDPAALTDLQHQRVGGDERVRGLVQAAVAGTPRPARRDRLAITDTCDRDSPEIPRD